MRYLAHYFIARGLYRVFGHHWALAVAAGLLILLLISITGRHRRPAQRLRWRRERR